MRQPLRPSSRPDESAPDSQRMGSNEETTSKSLENRVLRPLEFEGLNKEAMRNLPRYVRAREQKLQTEYNFQRARHENPNAEDWRITLQLLDENTPAGSNLYQKKLVRVDLPNGTSAEFKGNPGIAITEIMDRTNCHVQMAPGKTSYKSNRPDAFTALDLLGSFRENSLALDLLPEYMIVRDSKDTHMRLDVPLTVQGAPMDDGLLNTEGGGPDGEESHDSAEAHLTPNVPIRSVFAQYRSSDDRSLEDRIPRRPSNFTALSMSAYISDLCQPLPRFLQRHASPPATAQNRVEEVVSLFRQPEMAKFLSTRSLNTIIDFLEKTSNVGAFRQLAQHLGNAGYAFAASNWDRILFATAKSGDVHSHRYTLKAMLRQGLKPTATAWVTLHDLVRRRSPSQAHVVADVMQRKGLLHDRSAAELVARNAVEYELSQFLVKKKSVEAFIKFYDRQFQHTYGLAEFNWLSVSVANRMLKVLLMAGRRRDALHVLDVCKQRNPRMNLNESTLRTLISTACFGEDVRLAIAMLKHFSVRETGPPPLDARSCEMLFKLIWRRRYYNMLRVIWRYACTVGHISYWMETRMRISLTRGRNPLETHRRRSSTSSAAAPRDGETRGSLWDAFAARIAIGPIVETKSSRVSVTGDAQEERGETSFHDALEHHSPSPATEAFRAVVKALTNLELVGSLADMLESAYERDMQWKQRGLGLPKGLGSTWLTPDAMLQEMTENAIPMPMRKKRVYRRNSLESHDDAALRPIIEGLLIDDVSQQK